LRRLAPGARIGATPGAVSDTRIPRLAAAKIAAPGSEILGHPLGRSVTGLAPGARIGATRGAEESAVPMRR